MSCTSWSIFRPAVTNKNRARVDCGVAGYDNSWPGFRFFPTAPASSDYIFTASGSSRMAFASSVTLDALQNHTRSNYMRNPVAAEICSTGRCRTCSRGASRTRSPASMSWASPSTTRARRTADDAKSDLEGGGDVRQGTRGSRADIAGRSQGCTAAFRGEPPEIVLWLRASTFPAELRRIGWMTGRPRSSALKSSSGRHRRSRFAYFESERRGLTANSAVNNHRAPAEPPRPERYRSSPMRGSA